MRAEQLVRQEELPPGPGSLGHLRTCHLERCQCLQGAQGGVEGGVGRLPLAVPATVGHLLGQKALHGTGHRHPRTGGHREHHGAHAGVLPTRGPDAERAVGGRPLSSSAFTDSGAGTPRCCRTCKRVERRSPLRGVPPGRPDPVTTSVAQAGPPSPPGPPVPGSPANRRRSGPVGPASGSPGHQPTTTRGPHPWPGTPRWHSLPIPRACPQARPRARIPGRSRTVTSRAGLPPAPRAAPRRPNKSATSRLQSRAAQTRPQAAM